MKTEYQWSDAWILLATVYSARGQPAVLPEVIAAADYIQHAIVTYEEMEGALARLTAGGLIVDISGKLAPSQETINFYNTLGTARRPVLEEERDIERFLNASSWNPSVKPNEANRGVSYPSLSQERYNEAVQEYLSRFPKLTGVKRKKKRQPNQAL